jgi:aryl-alcohol dehydrogenase-like predicted oxidoreductase
VLALCKTLLDPVGIAYVSYNTYPGWCLPGIVRELVCSHAPQHWPAQQRLSEARKLLGRDVEHEVVPFMQYAGIGMTVWSPLAGGFLSGKYTRDSEAAGDGRRSKFDFPPVDREKGFAIVDALLEVGAHIGASVAQVALAWLLHQPHVTSIIIGAKNAEQLKDNLGAVGVKLTAADLERIDQLSALTPEYPGWMFAMQGTDRRPGQSRDWSKMMKT